MLREKTFADLLRPLVEELGPTESARLCGVTRQSIDGWLRRPNKPPNLATQRGALVILGEAARAGRSPA